MRFAQVVWSKGRSAIRRLIHYIRSWPRRLLRFFLHLWRGVVGLPRLFTSGALLSDTSRWWISSLFLLFDCLAFPEIYETLMDLVKWRSRALTEQEQKLAAFIFGDSVALWRVRIDDRAWLGPKQYRIAYVSFYTINSWGQLSVPLLVHELVHVWQFEKHGSRYIVESLWAQRSDEGYNYGGEDRLQQAAYAGEWLDAFNFEQQAEIIEDYYRLLAGMKPQWGSNKRGRLMLQYQYVKELNPAAHPPSDASDSAEKGDGIDSV